MDQGPPVDAVRLDFSKTLNSVCYRLLIKKMAAMGHIKTTRWMQDILKNKTFRVKLSANLPIEGGVKSGEPRGFLRMDMFCFCFRFRFL